MNDSHTNFNTNAYSFKPLIMLGFLNEMERLQLEEDERIASEKSCDIAVDELSTLNTLSDLEKLGERLKENARLADIMEAEIRSDIHTYEFARSIDFESERLKESNFSIEYAPIQVKAVVDYFYLTFKADSSSYTFQQVRKAFKDAHISDDCYVDESKKADRIYRVRLNDINDKKALKKVVDLLRSNFGAKYEDLFITTIELALDFYNAPAGFLVALHKSMRYKRSDDNMRVYVDRTTKFTPVTINPFDLQCKINNGYNLGVNHRDESNKRFHAYYKVTDNGAPLPQSEHRPRFEVTLTESALNGVDCNIGNIKGVIRHGFKSITFTKLKDSATDEQKRTYRKQVKPFGQERKTYRDKSRNKTNLSEYLQAHAELNELIAVAVNNLKRKF